MGRGLTAPALFMPSPPGIGAERRQKKFSAARSHLTATLCSRPVTVAGQRVGSTDSIGPGLRFGEILDARANLHHVEKRVMPRRAMRSVSDSKA